MMCCHPSSSPDPKKLKGYLPSPVLWDLGEGYLGLRLLPAVLTHWFSKSHTVEGTTGVPGPGTHPRVGRRGNQQQLEAAQNENQAPGYQEERWRSGGTQRSGWSERLGQGPLQWEGGWGCSQVERTSDTHAIVTWTRKLPCPHRDHSAQ